MFINYDTLCSNVLFVKIEALKNVKTIETENFVCIWVFLIHLKFLDPRIVSIALKCGTSAVFKGFFFFFIPLLLLFFCFTLYIHVFFEVFKGLHCVSLFTYFSLTLIKSSHYVCTQVL